MALSHISCILKWSGTNYRVSSLSSTTLSHILLVLKWSGTNSMVSGWSSTTLSHMLLVLKWSGTSLSMYGLKVTAFSYIPWVLRWSETYANESGSVHTASLHISCVLKWSGTHPNNHWRFSTTSVHVSSVLKWPGTWSIQYTISPKTAMFIYALGWVRSKYILRWWFLYQIILKTTICYFHHLFSSSDMHQSITRLGCQAMCKSSSLIFAFEPSVFDNHCTIQ